MQPLRQLWLTFAAAIAIGVVSGQASAAPEDSHLILYPGSTAVYINGSKTQAQAATLELDGRIYLPAAELNNWFGIPVKWDGDRQAVQITTPKAYLEYSLADRTVLENGTGRKWGTDAELQGNRLYIEMAALQQYIAFHGKVDHELKRVELRYVKPEANRTRFTNDAAPNVKPVAKFTVDKEAYRIGEPIHYSNLSYDPKGTELRDIQWIGNAQAIFTPGLYKVSLTVKDSLGNVSDTYSRNILVKNEPYLDAFEHKVYYAPVGTYVREEEAVLRKYLRGIPQIPKQEQKPADRPLIVSDSPETFTEKGFLYQEKVNDKARLYATHVNGTDRKMKFAIIVRNSDPVRSVTIKTTNQGEVYPSIYANLMGNEPTIEFLQGKRAVETMVLRPYETAYYKVMPDFYPGQGMNVLYDVETDGEVYFSFAAMEQEDGLDTIGVFPRLAYKGNVRGTFSGSEVQWNIDASSIRRPSSFAIGDGTSDQFVTGTDFFSQKPALNLGNYGVVYKIHIDAPPKMSVLILPRGGVFRGPFLVNGKIVQAPPSGVMMDYQGYTIIARTNGTEPSLDLEFSPASGSAFPIDVIFYPLNRK
ncbi:MULTISPECIES: stalk domain-containing protein [unclassified Paenibacillus]|uniref:stalk domain-containing protein n=1 Tax=unclassified Paenibacillus TaxID=185978 RepID=UPI002117472B|nr:MULTISPECIES: stalk domain-containing protein [unclassified Paenibacillus]